MKFSYFTTKSCKSTRINPSPLNCMNFADNKRNKELLLLVSKKSCNFAADL